MKTLRYIGMAILAVILSVNFAACSDDDEWNTESDNLQEIIVGAWAQDGDDDILVINADGTGIGYEDSQCYEQNEICYTFTWTRNNEWVDVRIDFYGTLQKEEYECPQVANQ